MLILLSSNDWWGYFVQLSCLKSPAQLLPLSGSLAAGSLARLL